MGVQLSGNMLPFSRDDSQKQNLTMLDGRVVPNLASPKNSQVALPFPSANSGSVQNKDLMISQAS